MFTFFAFEQIYVNKYLTSLCPVQRDTFKKSLSISSVSLLPEREQNLISKVLEVMYAKHIQSM